VISPAIALNLPKKPWNTLSVESRFTDFRVYNTNYTARKSDLKLHDCYAYKPAVQLQDLLGNLQQVLSLLMEYNIKN